MNELSLFSGAGGGLLASKLLNHRIIGYVENEEYCQKVIRQRIEDGILDEAPIFGDIKTFNREGFAESYQGMVDIVSGGFPCQDISCAGSGEGIEGSRSGLWSEMAATIRTVRPGYVFVENSPMLTIRGLGTVLRDLAQMGYDARWGVVSAADIGAPHIRKRIWVLGYTPGKRLQKSNFNIRQHAKEQEKHTRSWQNRRLDKPGINGVAHGVAFWVDRLKAIGNGQLPAVAAYAFEYLRQSIERG